MISHIILHLVTFFFFFTQFNVVIVLSNKLAILVKQDIFP